MVIDQWPMTMKVIVIITEIIIQDSPLLSAEAATAALELTVQQRIHM